MIVYKYGFTDDLERRLIEHNNDYGKLKNELWTKIEVSHLDKKKEEFNITIRDFNKKLGLSSFYPFKLLDNIRQEFNRSFYQL